jgi:predicted enzyme related to lactoylglutathione lyase
MSTPTKPKPKNKKTTPVPASIIWFEIPADDAKRAKAFYSKLFGWKITKFPGPMPKPYWHIDTGGGDDTPDGGLLERQSPEQTITNYINVTSVDQAAAKVQKLGGKVLMAKTAVPHMGYFVICQDTENNAFALWERTDDAN